MERRKIVKGFMVLGVLTCMLMATTKVGAQNVVSPSKFYAYSLLNFSKQIRWPDSKLQGVFYIAIVGDMGCYNELKRITKNMTYGQLRYEVKYYKKAEEIMGYHNMVFLSNVQSGKVKLLKTNQPENAILYVTERDNMEHVGAFISFTVDRNDKMGFKIFRNSFSGSALKYSERLAGLAENL